MVGISRSRLSLNTILWLPRTSEKQTPLWIKPLNLAREFLTDAKLLILKQNPTPESLTGMEEAVKLYNMFKGNSIPLDKGGAVLASVIWI